MTVMNSGTDKKEVPFDLRSCATRAIKAGFPLVLNNNVRNMLYVVLNDFIAGCTTISHRT